MLHLYKTTKSIPPIPASSTASWPNVFVQTKIPWKGKDAQTPSISPPANGLLKDDFLNVLTPLNTFRPPLPHSHNATQNFSTTCRRWFVLGHFFTAHSMCKHGRAAKGSCVPGPALCQAARIPLTARRCLTHSPRGQPSYYSWRENKKKFKKPGGRSPLTVWALGQKKQESCASWNTGNNFTWELP